MEGLDTKNPNDSTEHVGLLEINVGQFGCAIFNVLDSLANVSNSKFGGKGNGAVETIYVCGHFASKILTLQGE